MPVRSAQPAGGPCDSRDRERPVGYLAPRGRADGLPTLGVDALQVRAGLHDVEAAVLRISLEHPDFDSWWEPFTRGVGPAGGYLKTVDKDRREAIRLAARREVPDGPFEIAAVAWAARGLA